MSGAPERMEHKYNEPEKPSAENENQNKDGNQRGQLELWQRAANRGVSGIRNQGPRTKERGPRNCRQGAKKQSNIHLLFNTKTQFVHSPGNHQQTSPAGILLLHTHTHTHTRESGRIARSHRYASRYRYTRQIVGKFEWLWPEGAGRRTQDATYAAKHNGKPS